MLGRAGGGALPSYFALGDSHTAGAVGDTGGFRQFFRRLGVGTGPYTDVTGGRKHAGVSGNRIDQMGARFVADWTGNEASMILWGGAANDVAQGANAAQTQTRWEAAADIIFGEVGAGVPVFFWVQPVILDDAEDHVTMWAHRKIQNSIAADRSAGRRVYMLDTRFLTAAAGDFDSPSDAHPIDGVYGEDGVGTGYGKVAAYLDRYWTPSRGKTPLQLGVTCEGWYRADDVATTGGVIDQWNDKSGNARHMTSTTTQRAAAVTGLFGRAAGRFNGSSTVARTGTGFTISQPYWVWVVVGASGNNNGVLFESAGTPRCTMFGSGAGLGLTYNAGSSVTEVDLNPQLAGHMYTTLFSGANSKNWVDGVDRRLALSIGTNGQNGFAVGATFAPSNYFLGDIYELAVFSGTPTEAQVFDLNMYGAQRYGFWPTSPLVVPAW